MIRNDRVHAGAPNLARTIEAGRTERALSREWSERLTRTAMPSLRVAEFNMSSVSKAN